VVHSWLTGWLQHMRQAHPGLELELTVETTPLLIDQLQRGRLDLIFAALPAGGEGVHTLALSAMPMAFVGNAHQHGAAGWTLARIAEFDLLTFQRGSQPHAALLQLFRRHGLAPRVHAISSISAMAQLVETGFGIATLPQATLERLARRSGLRALACDAALEPLPIHASFRADPSMPLLESALASAPGFTQKKKRRSSSKKPMTS
jgi:DNA-binding transcriptional LysR family regulator